MVIFEDVMKLLCLCFRPFGVDEDWDNSDTESLGLCRDIGRYGSGEFSMAVVQANQHMEDYSQMESASFGTFVGVYDGHGGPHASSFISHHLFSHFHALLAEKRGIVTTESIERAFHATEEGFTALVSDLWTTCPHIAASGSCCLVGVMCRRTLLVANLGDSRVVLGRKVGKTGVVALQLSTEHNANIASIRQELKEQHPNDPQIVVLKHGVWRVKGIIQVSRSIGDVYLKHPQYNMAPINGKFRLPQPTNMPILSAKPTIISHYLRPDDSFLIFASDGLWEHLTNEKAVEIVHNHPRAGSARRLVKAALQEAARKKEMRFSEFWQIDKKNRRHFHDDITVIILFLNHDLISIGGMRDPPLSIRSDM